MELHEALDFLIFIDIMFFSLSYSIEHNDNNGFKPKVHTAQ